MTDDFSIWLEGAPVIPSCAPGTPGSPSDPGDFSIWLEGAPVVESAGDSGNLAGIGRRRAFIF